MGGAVVGLRQLQNVLEIIGQDGEPPPVGQAIRKQRDQRAAENRKNAEPAPGAEQKQQIAPERSLPARLGAGERIDHLAEQHRLGELRDRERKVAAGENPAQLALGPEQGEHPRVQADEIHDAPGNRQPSYKEKSMVESCWLSTAFAPRLASSPRSLPC